MTTAGVLAAASSPERLDSRYPAQAGRASGQQDHDRRAGGHVPDEITRSGRPRRQGCRQRPRRRAAPAAASDGMTPSAHQTAHRAMPANTSTSPAKPRLQSHLQVAVLGVGGVPVLVGQQIAVHRVDFVEAAGAGARPGDSRRRPLPCRPRSSFVRADRSSCSTEPEEKSSSRLLTCWKPKIASETAIATPAAANVASSRPPSGAAGSPARRRPPRPPPWRRFRPAKATAGRRAHTTASARHNR